MSQRLKILYVGDCREGTKSWMMGKVFQGLGHRVVSVDASPKWRKKKGSLGLRILDKLFRLFRYHHDFSKVNSRLLKFFSEDDFDLVWFTKVNVLLPDTVKRLNKHSDRCKLVYFTSDDLMNPLNCSIHLLKALPGFNRVISTNPNNSFPEEKKKLNLENLVWENFFFDEEVHRPVIVSQADRARYDADVVFVGSYEEDRANHILMLGKAGISVVVWGSFWPKTFGYGVSNIKVMRQDLSAWDYAKAVQCAKITLGFLRKANRDVVTGRSVEIPAAGAFMLMERTEMHLEMFEEDKEAAFFSGGEELIAKVKHYLGKSELRTAIAKAGHARVHRDGYSYQKRFPRIIQSVLAEP